MTLEQAGISLEAQNFNRYIKQLDTIDKAQQDIFSVDSKPLSKGFNDASKSAGGLQGSVSNLAGTKGLGGLSKGLSAIGPKAIAGFAAVGTAAVAAAAAIVAIGAASLKVAGEIDGATNQIASSLGISRDAAKEYREEVENIFVANPAAQFNDIAEAIALTEKALDGLTGDELENVANTGLLIQQQFGQDLQKTIGATEQLIEQFGLSSQEATDLLTFGLQNIPAEDLIDTVGEYSNQFAQAGFSANEFFSVLQTGVAGGVLGTDRIADATKEFQNLFLGGDQKLRDSLGALGLSYDKLSQDVNSGGRTISDVFGLIVDRSSDLDLSVASNRAIIAGLGTQFEDLGASAIAALDVDAIGLNEVAGAADTLNARFDNVGDTFAQLGRAFLVSIAPIGQTLLESLAPAVATFRDRVIPAFEFAGEALERLIESLGLAGSSSSAFEATLNATATVIEGLAGGVEILARSAETLRQIFAFARAGAAAFGSIIGDVITTAVESVGFLGEAITKLVSLDFAGAAQSAGQIEIFDFGEALDRAGAAALSTFEEIALGAQENPVEIPVEIGGAEGDGGLAQTFDDQTDAIGLSDEALQSYQNTLKQAEQLQQSFARSAEDNAIRIARANEDIARKQAKEVSDLEQSQAKDRDELLNDQVKQLDKFEADRRKQIAKAESDIAKARKAAADQQKRDQEKLQRELQQAQERFNLSQLQSERRFGLQSQRLRAEGDILALQQLKEDRALEQQEEKENFSLSQKERKQSGEEQQRQQAQDLDAQLSDLKASLENERAELLASFDEQLLAQQQAQAEARAVQQQAFNEQAAERAIQLQREEEDRRLSQQRQLEDLGQSFADQEGVTTEGATAIANELGKVFGVDGTADSIMSGFTEKTKNDFADLFTDIEKIVKDAETAIEPEPVQVNASIGTSEFSDRIGGIQRFQDGGIVSGPIGSPQPAIVHGGETVLPTHRQSFTMTAPVIPSQNLNVNMSGGFDIRGGESAGSEATRQAITEMTDAFEIVVKRLGRQVS